MTRLGLVAAAALFLAAGCGAGGGDKGAFVKQCVKNGENSKACTCLADALQKNLDPQSFKAIVLTGQGKMEEANRARSKIPADKQGAMALAVMEASGKCGAEAL